MLATMTASCSSVAGSIGRFRFELEEPRGSVHGLLGINPSLTAVPRMDFRRA